jgi:hypothetical protein
VHLTYQRSNLDYLAYLLTFLGIVLLIFMRIRGDVQHANTHPFGNESDPDGSWDNWDSQNDELLVDPTPSDRWHPDFDDPLDSDLDAESLVWAAPTDVPDVSGPPDANL